MGNKNKGENMERETDIKGFLKKNIETYYWKSFLKYLNIWKEFKWSNQIMEETMSI